jgi:hypothetical protein
MKKNIVALLLITVFFGAQVVTTQAQQGQVKQPVKTRVDEKGVAADEKKTSASGIALDVRLAGGIGLPMGSLSAVGLGLGGGGHLGVDFKLPFALGPVELMVGAQGGFYGLGLASSNGALTASVTLMPFLGFAMVTYPIKNIGITPFLGLGGGATMVGASVSGSSSTSLSSLDATMAFRAGASYMIPGVPKLSVLLNLSYLMIFEADLAGNPNNAQLLGIELGVSYRILGN